MFAICCTVKYDSFPSLVGKDLLMVIMLSVVVVIGWYCVEMFSIGFV